MRVSVIIPVYDGGFTVAALNKGYAFKTLC